jgi:hypothetical protein
MKIFTLVTSAALLVFSSQVAAAPVFVDAFADSVGFNLVAQPTETKRRDTSLLSGDLRRRLVVENRDSSDGDITARLNESSSGVLSVSKNDGATGLVDLWYTGAALSGLTNFTGSVTFDLIFLDQRGLDVFLRVDGERRDSVMNIGRQRSTDLPTTISLSYAGDWSDGFRVIFRAPEAADFRIDNLALVPAPGTLALLGLGLLAVVGAARRKSAA